MLNSVENTNQELMKKNEDLSESELKRSRQMRDFEKQLSSTKLEKEDLSRDLVEAQEKLKLQSKVNCKCCL